MLKTKKIKVGGQTFKLIRKDSIYADHHVLGRCFKDRGVIEYAGGVP